jgi:hypothetical protein
MCNIIGILLKAAMQDLSKTKCMYLHMSETTLENPRFITMLCAPGCNVKGYKWNNIRDWKRKGEGERKRYRKGSKRVEEKERKEREH